MSTLFAADEAKALLDAAIRGEMPDERGRFGPFGGRYVPETLVPAFERLEEGRPAGDVQIPVPLGGGDVARALVTQQGLGAHCSDVCAAPV